MCVPPVPFYTMASFRCGRRNDVKSFSSSFAYPVLVAYTARCASSLNLCGPAYKWAAFRGRVSSPTATITYQLNRFIGPKGVAVQPGGSPQSHDPRYHYLYPEAIPKLPRKKYNPTWVPQSTIDRIYSSIEFKCATLELRISLREHPTPTIIRETNRETDGCIEIILFFCFLTQSILKRFIVGPESFLMNKIYF